MHSLIHAGLAGLLMLTLALPAPDAMAGPARADAGSPTAAKAKAKVKAKARAKVKAKAKTSGQAKVTGKAKVKAKAKASGQAKVTGKAKATAKAKAKVKAEAKAKGRGLAKAAGLGQARLAGRTGPPPPPTAAARVTAPSQVAVVRTVMDSAAATTKNGPPGAPARPARDRLRIVVDPGHGGHDPGAVGPTGLQEKEVVLAIGLELKRLLQVGLGAEVVMTRARDVFIPLRERTAHANRVDADLFLSVHANAAVNRQMSGIETYYLNLAKTEAAAQVAARENDMSLEHVSLLQATLFDLMANAKLNESARFAELVQRTLYRAGAADFPQVKNLGVKQGPFHVLVGATMPSILAEVSFVSNPAEEQRLKDPAYRDQLALGLARGVAAYLDRPLKHNDASAEKAAPE